MIVISKAYFLTSSLMEVGVGDGDGMSQSQALESLCVRVCVRL